jgi:hypothetical protein
MNKGLTTEDTEDTEKFYYNHKFSAFSEFRGLYFSFNQLPFYVISPYPVYRSHLLVSFSFFSYILAEGYA